MPPFQAAFLLLQCPLISISACSYLSMITLAIALKEMEKLNARGARIPFSVAYITADREAWHRYKRITAQMEQVKPNTEQHKLLQEKRNSLNIGGRAIILNKCVMTGRSKSPPGDVIIKTELRKQLLKDPRHWKNRTRNFKLQNGELRKAHIRTMMEFNKQPIIF